MALVRIIRDYDWPDILRQTPGGQGMWDGIRFTEDPTEACDYVIISDRITKAEEITCDPTRVWALMHEPPNEVFQHLHRGPKCVHRVFTQNPSLKGRRYVHTQPALPWHVDHNYDWLQGALKPDKTAALSWITTNKTNFVGHRARISFLEAIRGDVDFDLFGYGFEPLKNKWEGLAPYRYSLAIENFRNPHYWSEKIADCFLAWTMPIYYGCTRISEYFPEESLVNIDIQKPREASATIKKALESDLCERHRDAIAEARRRVLEEHQVFPFLARHIRDWEEAHPNASSTVVQLSQEYRWPDAARFAAEDALHKGRRCLQSLRYSLLPRRG